MSFLKKKSPQQQLFNAIASADVKKVRNILEGSQIDINTPNGRGMTALDACAEQLLQYKHKTHKTKLMNKREDKTGAKRLTGLVNVWSELWGCSGTLKRYADTEVAKSGIVVTIPPYAPVTCLPPKASGGNSPNQPPV